MASLRRLGFYLASYWVCVWLLTYAQTRVYSLGWTWRGFWSTNPVYLVAEGNRKLLWLLLAPLIIVVLRHKSKFSLTEKLTAIVASIAITTAYAYKALEIWNKVPESQKYGVMNVYTESVRVLLTGATIWMAMEMTDWLSKQWDEWGERRVKRKAKPSAKVAGPIDLD